MADELKYNLTYAGIPFIPEQAVTVRLNTNDSTLRDRIPEADLHPRKFQTEADLMEEINRKLPWEDLNDFVPPLTYPGRNLGAIAHPQNVAPDPAPTIKAGNFYYPTGAGRWSVFRMFATSSMAKQMVAAALVGGSNAKPLVMKNLPISPDKPVESNYSITTNMYMMPPRSLGELAGGLDGLYLVTLVDERWYWQFRGVSLDIDQNTTWAQLIQGIGAVLGVTATHSTIEPAFTQPEQDSQLWANAENAGVLFDAIAWNVGRVVVRNLDGSYQLQTNTEAEDSAASSRGAARSVVRLAGGDMFNQETSLPIGDLSHARNAVVPSTITVTFPQYIIGNDPVPHLVNTRYRNQRPSAWYEESYGEVYRVNVPIASGGHAVSGMTGTSANELALHTTAKALYSGEAQLASPPLNNVAITEMAMAIANTYWEAQAQPGLDESYPGIYAWAPDGYYDILWTWSKLKRLTSTRVMRTEWNQLVREYQHATPALTNYTNTMPGVGGPSVAQTWRDSYGVFSGLGAAKTLTSGLTSTGMLVGLSNLNYLPTDQRWRGKIENEIIVFEGTSGGPDVSVALRGVDGTVPALHGIGNAVEWVLPNTTYGVNLATHGKGFFVNQAAWKSGGISESLVQCPLRTVRVLTGSGEIINSILHYSGRVNDYDPSKNSGSQFPNDALCWIQERNGGFLQSGTYLGGQLGGYGVSGSPVYLVNGGASGSNPASSGLPPVNARDQYNISGSVTPTLNGSILAGDTSYSINDGSYLPTQNRWVAVIDSEALLLEGTSGGINSLGIVQRGFLGTTAAAHANGAAVRWQMPNAVSGVNLTTYDKGFLTFYGTYTSGGNGTIEARLRCPIRTVAVVDGTGTLINGYRHFSGVVTDYNPAVSGNPLVAGGPYTAAEPIWIVERNSQLPNSGWRYGGQLVAFSASGALAPVYSINTFLASGQVSSSSGGGGTPDTFLGFQYRGGEKYGGGNFPSDTSGLFDYTIQVYDTSSFRDANSGTIFNFTNAGIGKYHIHMTADVSAAANTTSVTQGPAPIGIMLTNWGIGGATQGTRIDAAEDYAWVFSLKYVDDPFSTGTVYFEYTEATIDFGWDIDITGLTGTAPLIETWGTNGYTTLASFSNIGITCHKVNRAASVTSG